MSMQSGWLEELISNDRTTPAAIEMPSRQCPPYAGLLIRIFGTAELSRCLINHIPYGVHWHRTVATPAANSRPHTERRSHPASRSVLDAVTAPRKDDP